MGLLTCPGIVASPQPVALVANGLLLDYDFVEGVDDQVVYDQSGNGNDGQRGSTTGADTNDFSWITTPASGGDFVTDDYVKGPVLSTPTGSNPAFTLQLLVEPDTIGSDRCLVHYGKANTSFESLVLSIQASGQVRYEIWAGSDKDSSASYVSAGSPVLLTYASEPASRSATLYKNRATAAEDMTANNDVDLTNTNGHEIGRLMWPVQSWYFDGKIFHAAYYDRRLTVVEIEQNYDVLKAKYPGLGLP